MRIVIALLFVITGCTKQNPQACCTDATDCMNVGLPTGTVCDDGLLCRGNRCVEETCSGTGDCDTTAPYCVKTDEGRCSETCTGDSQCPGFGQTDSGKFCVSGACVQCRVGMNDCPVDAPLCSPEGQCVACVAHADCATGVCAGGACAMEDEIAYVSTNGSPASDCTPTSPCNTIDRAQLVVPPRKYILIEQGTYSSTSALTITGVRWLIGKGSVRPVLTRSTDGPIVVVAGTVDAKLEHLEVFGARGTTTPAGHGIECHSPGAPKLELVDVLSRMNAVDGFNGLGCMAQITRSQFSDNAQYGISNGEGSSSIDRSTIINNGFTGVFVDAGLHTVTNSVIARNRGWGVDLYSTSNGSRVEFSTIVDNGSANLYGGVMCNLVGVSAAWPSNIIARNPGSQTVGPCVYPNSIVIDTDIAPLKFVRPDAPPYDYHIQAGSIAIDAGTVSTIKTDFDGEARPFGAGTDVGADELH